MLLESSSDQKKMLDSNDQALKESDFRIFTADPPLTLFENSHLEDMLFSQLDYFEEKQTAMMYKQQQVEQLRDNRNPLVGRLLDLQKRKPNIVEKPPGAATVKDVQGRRVRKKDGFLVTTEPYFLGCHSQTPAVSLKTDEKNSNQSAVEVPSFRESKVPKIRLRRLRDSSCWEILPKENEIGPACNEDTSDEAYKKLHDKLEKGEMKMKRRDLQRQKDEELKMKARERSLKKKGKKTQPKLASSSLLPSPEEVTHIQVEDYLPVTAFGLPVPHLSRSKFSLPWLNPSTTGL